MLNGKNVNLMLEYGILCGTLIKTGSNDKNFEIIFFFRTKNVLWHLISKEVPQYVFLGEKKIISEVLS